VDKLLGRREIVVKSMGVFVDQHPLYSGATIGSDGEVVLILNAPNLAELLRGGVFTVDFENIASTTGQHLDTTEPVDSLSVLVVDDSLSVRKSLENQLTQLHCKVTLAADGVDALEKMRHRFFDLILTDLEMPHMDGFQLIVETRGLSEWDSVPIYVVTSRAVDKYLLKAQNLGATGYLVKPVSTHQLAELASSILTAKRSSSPVA